MKIQKILHSLLYPTTSHLNDVQKQLRYENNKKTLIWIISALIYGVTLFEYDKLMVPHISCCNLIISLSLLFLFLITCRNYFDCSSLLYFVYSLIYPFLASLCEGGFSFALSACIMLPIVVLIKCENWVLSIITLGYGIAFINTRLLEMSSFQFQSMNILEITDTFITVITICSCLIFTIIWTYSRGLKKFYKSAAEKKKIEYSFSQQNNFLLSFSHELRNPLNSMLGNIQLALFQDLSNEVREFLEDSQLCGEMLLHLISNILDSGKASLGTLEVTMGHCNIFDVCEKVWGISRRLIMRKEIAGTLRIAKDFPVFLKADSYRLTQILLNLIGNSVKFTAKGKISIKLDWLEGQAVVSDKFFEPIPYDENDEGIFEKNLKSHLYLGDDEDYFMQTVDKKFRVYPPASNLNMERRGILRIIVNDTGCGMSKSDLTQLFSRFSQVSTDSSVKQAGSGLGLYLSRELTMKMNGDIRVFSERGIGTSFIVCIPTVTSPVPIGSEPIPRQFPQSSPEFTISRGLKALAVDDNEPNLQIIVKYMQTAKINHKTAVNGLEAVTLYEEAHKNGQQFDIVTMDYDMPMMNGEEAVRRIRSYEEKNNIRKSIVIMISGYCDENIIQQCLDTNRNIKANYFLKKPVLYEDLMRIISKHRFF